MRVVLLPEDVGLHLVDHRRHLGEGTEVKQTRGVEVADADGTDEALIVGTLHVAPGRVVVVVRLQTQSADWTL